MLLGLLLKSPAKPQAHDAIEASSGAAVAGERAESEASSEATDLIRSFWSIQMEPGDAAVQWA
ncbi:MAG TPA: hypothetical protein VK524_30905 [Polyangiaceae bacterium]|nr:hypothetical protein [Polyangiaceae bacterium]